MQIGSLVKCVSSFEDLRLIWKFDYPKIGDILTISNISKHPNKECSNKGIVLLSFEEKPDLIFGVCDKTVDGKVNFVEVLPPINLEEELKFEFEHSS